MRYAITALFLLGCSPRSCECRPQNLRDAEFQWMRYCSTALGRAEAECREFAHRKTYETGCPVAPL